MSKKKDADPKAALEAAESIIKDAIRSPKDRGGHVRSILILLRQTWETPGPTRFLPWKAFAERGADPDVAEYLLAERLVTVKYPIVAWHRSMVSGCSGDETVEFRVLEFYGQTDHEKKTRWPLVRITPKGIERADTEMDELCRSAAGAIRAEAPTPPPLTEQERRVLDIIDALPEGEGITGAAILERLRAHHKTIIDQSVLTGRIIPTLKQHYGVANRPKAGYYRKSL